MIRELLKQIKDGQDVRAGLIELKAELKDTAAKHALLYHIGTDYEIFYELLKNEDAKVRKNAALIMGQLCVPEFLDKLYDAYEKEEQLFVKSSYLTAIKEFDYRNILPQLKERLEKLNASPIEESNKKHITEEIRVLSSLILGMEGVKKHEFCGYNETSRLILLTNRNFKNITLEQINEPNAKEFNAGVMVKSKHLKELLPIRTYQELLFVLEDIQSCDTDPEQAAKAIAKSSLLEFLKKRHKGNPPFHFRIELKSKLDIGKKSSFTKKLAGEIERLSDRQLINSTSNYEVELRLIENKEGRYNVLVKLYTLKDERFSYRKNVVAASIQPVNAALTAALAKEYLKEEGRILDPFCGVGTMLMERHKLVPANTMYGIDIYGPAIQKARENTDEAGLIIHYINRDFFEFQHEYLFDEIITNMPFVTGHKQEDEIFELYQKFFSAARGHLEEQGTIIMYSHNKEFVLKCLNKKWYRIIKEYEISKKEGCYLFIIKCN
jgi:Predicted N6-adenine-specific DNA methylase